MSDLLNSASLVMIPSGYKEDTVYSVVPSDGSGDMAFTRASNGTRVNSAGLVEVVPWNLVQYSEDLSNAVWDKGAITATGGQSGYDGTSNAWLITKDANAYRAIEQSVNNSGIYTFSVYAKANTLDQIYLRSQTLSQGAYFDLTNGTTSGISALSASIDSVGGGWYRCSVTFSGTSTTLAIYIDFEVATAGSVYVQNFQANIGSTAKPYFPTTDRLNVPRLTYQNGGGGCPSLLLEKQSTNELSYSNTSDWGLSPSLTKTQNTTDLLSPDGTNNATKIVSSAGTGDTSQGFSVANGTITLSFYGRVASGTKTLVVDLRNNSGTVTSFSPVLTTEWQRFTLINSTAGTGSSGAVWIYPNGAGTFYIYGAQVEESSYATSLILTTGASATRVADACFKTGISSLIGTDFTLFYDGYETTGGQSSRYVVLKGSGGTYNNYISLEGASNNRILAYVGDNSGTQIFSVFTGSLTNGQRVKMALRCKNNNFSFYLNGTEIFTQTSGSVPTTSDLYLGYYVDYDDSYNVVNQLAIFNQTLTNAELASLTTL